MNALDMEQLRRMEVDREKMIARLKSLPDGFEKEELLTSIRAHDVEVGKLCGLN